ncbi:uridine kinase [Streptomyces abyssalis]|uniref:Uridine kinase n=1 Tax=Streptomyces abyssalis TaxID=933944 RepID=A0A1E7JM58_9ACTN|nr:uridine kinase [Streptomyces abyssalis]OEU88710.1 uridine kinase [Streptomyces abyssalis]OEU89139.1 uridine kinase [Streptomyces abyssalis]
MRLEPVTWEILTEQLAEHVAGQASASGDGSAWRRVAVDGAPPAPTGELAEELAEALRLRGRPVLVVDADGFLRADSLRFEFGKQDPDAYYDLWYDTGALWREVFGPLDRGGDGRVLPDLRAPSVDRPTRSPHVLLPRGGVMVLHGPFLLGHWFPFDLSVHLGLSAKALERQTPVGERWRLPAFARYAEEVAPEEAADVCVRADKPRHPAWNGPPRHGSPPPP